MTVAFDELVKAGEICAIRLSNYTADRIEEWFRIARKHGCALPVALEPHYNLVVCGNYERTLATVALAWLRHRPQVAGPIASARTPEQLPALLDSVSLELTADEIAALDQASEPFAK